METWTAAQVERSILRYDKEVVTARATIFCTDGVVFNISLLTDVQKIYKHTVDVMKWMIEEDLMRRRKV